MHEGLPAETIETLLSSGWTPGRLVDIRQWIEVLDGEGFAIHEAARKFLSEFGGIFVDVQGSGISCARVPFELDPTLCSGESDRFSDWGRRLGRALYPIGELDYGQFFLAIDEDGVLFIVSDVVGRLDLREKGLDMLIRGIAADTEP